MSCWEYLAEAIVANQGCRCGHSRERHTRFTSRPATEWRVINGVGRSVDTMDESDNACTLCDCHHYWWDGKQRLNDPSWVIYPDCAA